MSSQTKFLKLLVFLTTLSLLAGSGCGLREQRKKRLEEETKQAERRADRRAAKQAAQAEKKAELKAAEAEKKAEEKAALAEQKAEQKAALAEQKAELKQIEAEKKAEQRSLEASERAEARAKEKAERDRLEAVEKAKRDLETRIRYMKGLEGEYSGTYAVGRTSKARLTLTISVQNLPAPFSDARALEAGQINSQMEAISLEVVVLEESLTAPVVASCSPSGLRPDFQRGLLTVPCTMSGTERKYFVTLDDEGIESSSSFEDSDFVARSALTSKSLIDGQIAEVARLNVRILTSLGKSFTVSLARTDSPQTEPAASPSPSPSAPESSTIVEELK